MKSKNAPVTHQRVGVKRGDKKKKDKTYGDSVCVLCCCSLTVHYTEQSDLLVEKKRKVVALMGDNHLMSERNEGQFWTGTHMICLSLSV